MKKKDTQKNKEDIVYEEETILGFSEEKKIKKLQDELKSCKKERQEYLDGWQRSRADFANQKTKEELRVKKAIEYAEEKILYDILPVLDSFDQAMMNEDSWQKVDDNWRKGIEYIYAQLSSVLKENGIIEIPIKIGDHFNPAYGEPLEMKDTEDENKDNTISAILKKGYMLNEKIIKPAIVNVYKFNS